MKWNAALVRQRSVMETVSDFNQAGIEAFRATEFSRADRYFRQALRVLQHESVDDEKAAREAELGLLRNLAQTHRKMGDLARAEAYYRRALDRVERGGVAEGHLLVGLGLLSHLRGDLSGAVDWTKKALEVYRACGDEPLAAGALVNLGVYTYESQAYDDAENWLHEALRLFMRSKQKWGLAKCYTELARVNLGRGLIEAALNHGREAMVVAADENDETELGRALAVSAQCYAKLGKQERASSYMEQARTLFTEQRAWYELKQLYDLEKTILGTTKGG